MSFKTKKNPETEVWNTFEKYLDNLTLGSGLEAPTGNNENVAFDLNALRTLMRHHLTGGVGARKWYDGPLNAFGLDQIHDKPLAFDTGLRPGTSDFTLGASAAGILVADSLLPSVSPLVAVGPASTTSGGYLAAEEAAFTVAGTLGVGTSQAVDAAGILLNRCAIVIAGTNATPQTVDSEDIFGLLQVVDGTADATAVAGSPTQNLQLSFVFIDKDTDVITATTLPTESYHFSTRRLSSFYELPTGALIGGAGLPEIIDPTQTLLKVPFREIDITSVTNPAAGDAMVITTGVFTTAGAQTVAAQFDTPALPASGADFVSDPRIKVFVNGTKVSKGVNLAATRDCYWVSATQLAFNEKLIRDKTVIYIEAPSAY